MAKKTWSLSDFDADEGALGPDDLDENEGLDEQEEQEENEEQEEEEEEVVPAKVEKKTDKKVKKASKPTEDEEEEEEVKPTPKDKKKVQAKTKPIVEEQEEEEEEEQESEEKEEGENEEETTDSGQFFEEVEKLTGRPVEVDYKDIDPLSPQGVAIREQAIRKDALDAFVDEIEAKYPDAFRALQHAYAGGNVSDLFTRTTARDYSNVQLKDDDVGLAKEIMKEFYKSKGIKSDARIAKMIEIDEDSESGLINEAKAALEEMKAEQEDERNKVIEAQKRQKEEADKKDRVLITAIDEVLESRKLGDFRLTDRGEAQEFRKFLFSAVRKTADGKYELSTPVDPNNLEKVLQYHYFQFKKGDLSKVIQRAATTENTKKLSLRLKADQSKTKKNTQGQSNTGFSLKDFNAQ